MPGLAARLERWGKGGGGGGGGGDLNKMPCGSTVRIISLKVCNQSGRLGCGGLVEIACLLNILGRGT